MHSDSDIGATIASGSFRTAGMIVAPCSMKTLSGIVASYADNLVVRAADVVLKERRRLVLMPRETPLHVGHCRLLLQAAEMGAIIAPPMPAFYNRPRSLEEAVDHSVGRVLDLFDIESDLVKRWRGARDEVGGRHESDAIVAAMNAPQRSSVLDAVPMAPSDPILGVSEAFVRDANPRKVNLGQATSAIESKAWKPFRTEFYPTYDFLSIQAELRGRSSGGG